MTANDHPFRMRVLLAGIVAALLVLSMAGAFLAASPSSTVGGGAASSSNPALASPSIAPPASGTIAINPSVFVNVNTLVTPSGGSFGSGATVQFCLGASVSGPWSAALGSVTLPAGQTTLASPTQALVTFSGSTMSSYLASATSRTGYVAATDAASCGAAGATYAGPASVTIFSSSGVNPQVSISPSPLTPGSSAGVSLTSGAFDPSATVTLYMTYPGSSYVLSTFTLIASGQFAAGAAFTVPTTLPQGTVVVVAQETSGPATSVLIGLTSDSSMTIAPTISVSPVVISGAVGSSLTITGLGFVASSTIAANSIVAGGVSTHHAAVPVSSTGGFSVVVSLATAISAPGGPESVSVTTAPASSVSSFASAFFVSNPNPGELKFTFSPSSLSPSETLTAAAWNFPAGASISFRVGSTSIGSAPADFLGYAALASGTELPGMPAGSYAAVAVDAAAGLYSPPVPVTVMSVTTATDPSGASLGGEYLPSGGTISVWSYGLVPATQYPFQDSALSGSIGAAYENGYATLTVILGSFDATSGDFLAAPNGTLAFAYSPLYALLASPLSTGTISTVSINSHAITTYRVIGAPTLSPSVLSTYAGGASVTFTVSALIPQNSLIYPGTPAVSAYYNLYIGGALISGTGSSNCLPGTPTTCFAPGGTLSITFTTPHTSAVESFAVTYLAGSASSPLGHVSILISVPGASVGSGTLTVQPNPSTGVPTAIAYGLFPTASVYDLNVSTSLGVITVAVAVGSSTGAFVQSLAAYVAEPAGTYGLYLYISTSTGSSATIVASYSVTVALAVVSPSSAQGPVGTSFSATATGLAASAYFDAYFGSTHLSTGQASGTGSATVNSVVPFVAPGTYTLSLDPAGTTHVSVSTTFTVTGSSTISLFTAGSDQSYAFPGELLTYDWTPTSEPAYSAPLTVTILLNGTAYTSQQATLNADGSISGSFSMPNACVGSATSCAGTYWWVTLNWTQWVVSGGDSVLTYYTEPPNGATFLQLVEGNGALLTGISEGQIAEITSAVNQTLEVPIAELQAAVVSINDATANITTQFGKMTATLSAINATVVTTLSTLTTGLADVENGIVTLQTSLGYVNTSLTSLGGRITSIEGTLGSLNTTLISVDTSLGVISTTLSAVDATVTSTATSVNGLVGSVAKISTTLGSINGTITAIDHGVATIQTQIGTLQTNISNVQTSVSGAQNSVQTALYWEIAAVALLIVTLALTAVLLGQARRPPRPPAPPSGWKAPPEESSPPSKSAP